MGNKHNLSWHLWNIKNKISCSWSWKKYHFHMNMPKQKRLKNIENFIGDVSWVIREQCLEKARPELEKLLDTCRFEKTEIDGELKDIMTWASPEYKKLFNESVVFEAIKLMENVHICDIKLVGKDKAIIKSCWCGILSNKSVLEKIKEKTGRTITFKSEKGTVMSSIYHGIHSLEYSCCANDLDELL